MLAIGAEKAGKEAAVAGSVSNWPSRKGATTHGEEEDLRVHSADRQQVTFRKRKGNSERKILCTAQKYTEIHDG